MIIQTKRLKIETNSLQHLDTTYEYFSDPETTKYTYFLPRSFEQTKAFLIGAKLAEEKNPQMDYELAIIYQGVHVGSISLNLFDLKIAEIGWVLNKKYQHLGIATEAAFALLEFAKTLGLEKIIAHCDTRNAPSYHLMEKLGMKRVSEGIREYRDSRGLAKEYLYEIEI